MKKLQASCRKAMNLEPLKETDYIFTWEDGRLFRPDYVSHAFRKFADRNGYEGIRFHDLRHSTASILYDMEWEVNDIKEWLGHSDISTTLNIYTHIKQQRKNHLASTLENKLSIG